MLWASAFPAIRAGLDGFSPGPLALVRFAAASAVAALIWTRGNLRLPEPRDLPAVVAIGLLGFTAYNLALNFGERTVSAGSAALIVSTVPVITALLAGPLLGERIPRRIWLGIAISFAGIVTITASEGKDVSLEPAALLVLVAAVAQAVFFVLEKPYLRRYRALELTVWGIWIGTVPLLAFAPAAMSELEAAGAEAVAAAVWLGIFPGALAYTTWAYALGRTDASRLAPVLYVVPVIAIAIAYLWLAEVPSVGSLIGGGVAIGGVVVVQRAWRASAH